MKIDNLVSCHIQVPKELYDLIKRREPNMRFSVFLVGLVREYCQKTYGRVENGLNELITFYIEESGHFPDEEEIWLLDTILDISKSVAAARFLITGYATLLGLHRIVRVVSKGPRGEQDLELLEKTKGKVKKGYEWV